LKSCWAASAGARKRSADQGEISSYANVRLATTGAYTHTAVAIIGPTVRITLVRLRRTHPVRAAKPISDASPTADAAIVAKNNPTVDADCARIA